MTLPIPLLFEFWKAGQPCPACCGTGFPIAFDDPDFEGDECGDCAVVESYVKEHHPDLWRKATSKGDPNAPIPF